MPEITLTRGNTAIVDEDDYERLSQYKWCSNVTPAGRPYAYNRKMGYMHKLIMPGNPEVDHINGDPLDNRKSNLRPATEAQQNMNKPKTRSKTTSRYKGVCWHTRRGKWMAYIYTDRKMHELGFFEDEKEAALKYDMAALDLFCDYARLNLLEV